MRIIDTHSHLYLKEFSADLQHTLERASQAGVEKIFLPNVDLDTADSLLNMSKNYPKICYPMMGLHPCSVQEGFELDLQALRQILDQNLNQIIAVGEIGIDLYWDKTTLNAQIKAFEAQIEWALELQLPIVIHARESFDEIFKVLENYRNTDLNGVFHCFTGSFEQAQWIVNFGFYLGIGGVITYKKSDLKNFIGQLPLDRLMLETDAPYLSPVPHRGKRNEPAFLVHVIDILAQAICKSNEETAHICSTNAMNLFTKAL